MSEEEPYPEEIRVPEKELIKILKEKGAHHIIEYLEEEGKFLKPYEERAKKEKTKEAMNTYWRAKEKFHEKRNFFIDFSCDMLADMFGDAVATLQIANAKYKAGYDSNNKDLIENAIAEIDITHQMNQIYHGNQLIKDKKDESVKDKLQQTAEGADQQIAYFFSDIKNLMQSQTHPKIVESTLYSIYPVIIKRSHRLLVDCQCIIDESKKEEIEKYYKRRKKRQELKEQVKKQEITKGII